MIEQSLVLAVCKTCEVIIEVKTADSRWRWRDWTLSGLCQPDDGGIMMVQPEGKYNPRVCGATAHRRDGLAAGDTPKRVDHSVLKHHCKAVGCQR